MRERFKGKVKWELIVHQNNILRAITFSQCRCSMTALYSKLHLLKLTDIYKLELAKFMFQLHNNNLPNIFYESLTKLDSIHNYNTRQLTKNVYFTSSITKTIGMEAMIYRGSKLWGEINQLLKLRWLSFKKQYKSINSLLQCIINNFVFF